MKAVIAFMLLFAVVYCHPVKRSASSSESTEVQPVDTQALKAAAVGDVNSEEDADSAAADDDDDDDDDSVSDESDENGETTISPPFIETTPDVVIYSRGDSIGYQIDYKKPIYYVDGNNIEKGPSSYKSYGSDKTKYDGADLKAYKALHVHNAGMDQGVDASSNTDSDDKAAPTSSLSQESEEDSQSSKEDTDESITTDSISSDSIESKEAYAADQPALLRSKNPKVIIA